MLPPQGGEAHVTAGLSLGGSAGLTARWLAALGCAVRLVAGVGDDPFGAWLVEALERDGVAATWLQRIAGRPTGLCIALVQPGGERALLVSPGACRDLAWEGIARSWLDGVGWLHLSGYAWSGQREREAAAGALRLARERRIPVSVDPGAAVGLLAQDPRTVGACDLLLPNRQEVQVLTGQGDPRAGAEWLRRQGAGWVAVKLDREGCFVSGPKGEAAVAAYPVEAGNTTGAGDAFNAGAIVGVLAGWAPGEVGALANLLGAAASRRGAGAPLPTVRYLQDLLDLRPGGATRGAWLRERWRKEGT